MAVSFSSHIKDLLFASRFADKVYDSDPKVSGFTTLNSKQLGLNGILFSGAKDTVFDTELLFGGEAAAFVKGSTLVISFRGTNSRADMPHWPNSAYYKVFNKFINAIGESIVNNDKYNIQNIYVTGHSLGGTAVNGLAKNAPDWLDVAKFVAFASPNLASLSGVVNFGMQNDIVYQAHRTLGGDAATQKFFYNDWAFSAHKMVNYTYSLERLVEAPFLSKINFDSEVHLQKKEETKAEWDLSKDVLADDAFILGNRYKDTIKGSNFAENIDGGRGDDRIWAHGGDDLIFGGAGRDQLFGGDGNDRIFGGEGFDYVYGGKGKNELYGGAGRDLMHLGGDGDFASGGVGADVYLLDDLLPRDAWGVVSAAGDLPATVRLGDFQAGADKLDLRLTDANLIIGGNQEFFFSEFKVYNSADGFDSLELGFVNDTRPGSVAILQRGDVTSIVCNRDADMFAELIINITGKVGNISSDIWY